MLTGDLYPFRKSFLEIVMSHLPVSVLANKLHRDGGPTFPAAAQTSSPRRSYQDERIEPRVTKEPVVLTKNQ